MSFASTSPSTMQAVHTPLQSEAPFAEGGRSRSWTYLLVALGSFLVGMALGQLGAVRSDARSRADWPAPAPAHPRSLDP
jgi:hypothetical protein